MDRLRQHIEHITSLTDEEFEYIQIHFTNKRVLKNQYLLHEGDEVKYECVVLAGLYNVVVLDEQGKEYISQFALEDGWMSDYEAFFQERKATVFIECIDAGEVLVSTVERREKLSAEMHNMEHF